MEEDKKYYIPDAADIYPGYVYYFNGEKVNGESTNNWKIEVAGTEPEECSILDQHGTNNGKPTNWYIEQGWVRSKYLDKEDVESLGWKENAPQKMLVDMPLYALYKSPMNKYTLVIDRNNQIQIWYSFAMNLQENKWKTNHLYHGECKSINELKKIMSWLTIQ